METVGVTLKDKGKVYYFNNNNLPLKKNLTVIVETEKGLQFGKVVKFLSNMVNNKDLQLKNVIRIATKKDYLQHLENIKDADIALQRCKDLIVKYKLAMTLLDSTYTFDRSQLLFRFVAEERIDFRQLAKELGSLFKTRIELRQVGIRDKAKDIGGIGPCGRILCCTKFLYDFDSVSINMAKNQSLALNPTKVNGVCGRLLCCLKYEDENYYEYKKNLPNIGDLFKTASGTGKVIYVDIFKRKCRVNIDGVGVVEEDIK